MSWAGLNVIVDKSNKIFTSCSQKKILLPEALHRRMYQSMWTHTFWCTNWVYVQLMFSNKLMVVSKCPARARSHLKADDRRAPPAARAAEAPLRRPAADSAAPTAALALRSRRLPATWPAVSASAPARKHLLFLSLSVLISSRARASRIREVACFLKIASGTVNAYCVHKTCCLHTCLALQPRQTSLENKSGDHDYSLNICCFNTIICLR